MSQTDLGDVTKLAALCALGAAFWFFGAWRLYRSLPHWQRMKAETERALAEINGKLLAITALEEELVKLVAASMALSIWFSPQRVGHQFEEWQPAGECPDCGSSELIRRPGAGDAVNFTCRHCAARWNSIPALGLIRRC